MSLMKIEIDSYESLKSIGQFLDGSLRWIGQ